MKNSEKAKSESMPKRISGQLRLPLAFILASPRVVQTCACLAERSDATCYIQAHVTVPRLNEYAYYCKW